MAKRSRGQCAALSALLLAALACGVAAAAAAAPYFVGRKGSRFVVNGTVFLFNGFNSYWMMNEAALQWNRNRVSSAFEEAAAAGLTVCRTWAFYDGGEGALQQSPGVYNEQVFQGLDFVISEARKHGFRLILSLVNNHKEYGGKAQYVQWARSAGVAIASDDDFFTNPAVKAYFKAHIQKVLTRPNTITAVTYKDDPTIMAWELMNEPQCQSDYSGQTVTGWVREMAAYAKSIDSNHLLGVGMEGLYGASTPEKVKQYNPNGYQVGTDFITGHKVNEVDFATIHAYPDIWLQGQSEENKTVFLNRWMGSHWTDAVKVIQKPLIFGEFGKSSRAPGFAEKIRDDFLASVYGGIYGYAKNGNASFGGGLVWQLLAEGMASYDDGYGIVLPQSPGTSAVVRKHSEDMKALAIKLATARKHDGRRRRSRHLP